jgi:hypothetical protein
MPKIVDDLEKIECNIPIIPLNKYALKMGLTTDCVRGQIKRGYLPTVRIGRSVYINLIELTQQVNDLAADQKPRL